MNGPIEPAPWKYTVTYTSPVDGSHRTVLVELAPHERNDALAHTATRGEAGPGGPNGPIAKGYAMTRAAPLVPIEFQSSMPDVKLVRRPALHLVH